MLVEPRLGPTRGAPTGAVAPPSLRIAMAVYGDARLDSRVQREATSLAAAGHDVTVYCLAGSPEEMSLLGPGVRVRARGIAPGAAGPGTASPFRRARRGGPLRRWADRAAWLVAYTRNLRAWGRWVAADAIAADVFHAHDFTALVALVRARPRGSLLVYDVHDLFVETGSGQLLPGPLRGAVQRYERHLVRRLDLVVAVNQAIAAAVTRRARPRSLVVVHNCPSRWSVPDPRPDRLRVATGIPSGAPVILYHGLLGSSRGIDRLLEVLLVPEMQGAHLVLMGYGELAETLRAMADEPRFGGRLHVLPAVPPAELLSWVASADVGALAMPNASRNLYLSTPNKLFECLAAGTPVVVSDFPAVRDIVVGDPRGPLGVVCDPASTPSVARAIGAVLAADPAGRTAWRERCSRAARERWNWETEVARLVEAYGLLAASARRGG